MGLSTSGVTWRVRAGRLHRVHWGVYAVGQPALSTHGRYLGAVLAAGTGAALSHVAAAELHRISRWPVDTIEVVRPGGSGRTLAGAVAHRSRALRARDVTAVRRIPVTSVARTLLDLGDRLTPHQLAWAIGEAQFRGRFSRLRVDAMVRPPHGRRAAATLAAALALVDAGSRGTRSAPEDHFLAAAIAAGLPEPVVNTPLRIDDDVPPEFDFVWPAQRLIVEVDGPSHQRRANRDADRRRDERVLRAGFRILRCPPCGVLPCVHRVTAVMARG